VDIIQEVGSYAGFAAVVGLAVLSALYFSQARDLRRLREWAGRAPERAAEQPVPGQTVLPEEAAQEAVRPAPSGAVRPIPAAKPAAAAAAGAAPATAGAKVAAATPPGKPATPTPAGKPGAPVPATAAATTGPGKPAAAPAAAGAAEGAAKPDAKAPGAAPTAGAPATATPAPATPAAAPGQAKPAAPAKPAATPAPAKPGTPAAPPPARPPVLPARPGPVGRSSAPPASQSTAVLPASSRLRDSARRPARGRSEGLGARYIALIVAGVIVLGGAAAFGISQLGGDDESGGGGDQQNQSDRQAPINPTTVTVSVLNGTTVPGLAAQIGDEVESAGFQRGNVANAIDQQRPSSVVLFAEGADREARLVARRLSIARVEPVDPDSQALAGNASVVVIVGADQTQ
jgi:hypothetical protein